MAQHHLNIIAFLVRVQQRSALAHETHNRRFNLTVQGPHQDDTATFFPQPAPSAVVGSDALKLALGATTGRSTTL
jgi:hypothetical protein